MDSSFGIRADDLGRRGIVLKEGNYRVWSTVIEQQFRENKLWNHILGTAVPPPAPRVRALGVAVVAAAPGVAAVVAIAEITQEQVDADDKKLEDFAANIARANIILLTSIEQKDVMALYGYDSPAKKWLKLRADYGLVSTQMATEARAKLNVFKMGGGESVIEIQHRFANASTECVIQGVPETDEALART